MCKLGVMQHRSPSETVQMLEAVYGTVAVKKTQVFEWHVHLCNGRTSVSDDPYFGELSTLINEENIEHLCSVV
jgi:hypothetical protein